MIKRMKSDGAGERLEDEMIVRSEGSQAPNPSNLHLSKTPRKLMLSFAVLMLLSQCLVAQEAARRLAERVLGGDAEKFVFVRQSETQDFFLLKNQGSKVCIVGNNDNSMAMGLNYYLKKYAKVHVSWYADDPVQLPKRMPKVREEERHVADVPTRFFLNYCTYGYTMVWWGWRDWERFIDWMALNGVNMPLALSGQEAVWQEVWREMGMTDDEIRAYFSGPTHLPWHRMANLDGFGGPLPQSWIDSQKDLQKRILKRERELCMTPVLPAFSGHVPRQVAERFPQADIKRLSSWCGFEPTYFMNATDSLFAVIQHKYLEKQTALYGTDHVYGADPFNEMDPPSWDPDYLAGVSRNIYASMQEVDAEAKWLQMSWVFYYKRKQWTPDRLKSYLTAVPQGRMILLDYFCEKTEVWRETQGFYGQPFIWCYLGNFGGNTMLVGNLHELDDKMNKAIHDQPGNMVGIGSTLEGFDNSPQTFEFLLEHPWRKSLIDERIGGLEGSQTSQSTRVQEFGERWADCRQGKRVKSSREAWKLLIDSVYKDWSFYGLGTQMTARPSLSGHGTYYTKPYYSYDNATLLRSIGKLLEHPSDRSGYQYDVSNFMRQWLGNHFMEVRDAFTDAYHAGDIEDMKRYRDMALEMIDQADVIGTPVVPSLYQFYMQELERDSSENCYTPLTNTFLTIWGGPILNDYANRMWSGLLSCYYKGRWKLFFDAVIDSSIAGSIHNRAFDEKRFGEEEMSLYEQKWANSDVMIGMAYEGPSPAELAKRLMNDIKNGKYDVPNRAEARLDEYMKRYPEAQLVDVYKYCFQDVYGPGHLIKDSAACAQAIAEEMELVNLSDTSFPDWEYAGIEGNYVRVNLRVIKDGRVPLSRYVEMLMRGAKVEKPMPIYDWQGNWMKLQTILRNLEHKPFRFDEDAEAIRALLDRGEYAAHHSLRFNQAYAPHYRLIRKDIFEKEVLPLLR